MPWLRTLFLGVVMVPVAAGADWPQWLGLYRDGSSPEDVAPWKDTLEVVWKQPVGEGHSSPVVADGKVFFHAKVKDKDEEEVTARDAVTGKLLWNTPYPRDAFKSIFGNGPRATPAVAGPHLYTLGVTGILTCLDIDTGKIVWRVDTLKEFQAKNLFFGVSCSPIVEGHDVLINVGGKGASIVAFDGSNGSVRWKRLDDGASYSSPIAFGKGETRQVVFLTQRGLVSLRPADGHVFWQYPLLDLLSESSSTPARVGNLLMASSITYGAVGLQLVTRGGKLAEKEIWKNPELTCYFSTPVAVGKDYLYVVTGTKPPAINIQSTLHCIDVKTGKETWHKTKVGKYHASLMRTGNNKLLMLADSGDLVLIDPDPKEYRELVRSKVCGECWAHPALADGRLYVRDNHELICLKVGQ